MLLKAELSIPLLQHEDCSGLYWRSVGWKEAWVQSRAARAFWFMVERRRVFLSASQLQPTSLEQRRQWIPTSTVLTRGLQSPHQPVPTPASFGVLLSYQSRCHQKSVVWRGNGRDDFLCMKVSMAVSWDRAECWELLPREIIFLWYFLRIVEGKLIHPCCIQF